MTRLLAFCDVLLWSGMPRVGTRKKGPSGPLSRFGFLSLCLESRSLDSRLILEVRFAVFDRVFGPVRTRDLLDIVEILAPDLLVGADIRFPLNEPCHGSSPRDHGQRLPLYQRVASDKLPALGDFAWVNRVHRFSLSPSRSLLSH